MNVMQVYIICNFQIDRRMFVFLKQFVWPILVIFKKFCFYLQGTSNINNCAGWTGSIGFDIYKVVCTSSGPESYLYAECYDEGTTKAERDAFCGDGLYCARTGKYFISRSVSRFSTNPVF